jgi:hypothetical protein
MDLALGRIGRCSKEAVRPRRARPPGQPAWSRAEMTSSAPSALSALPSTAHRNSSRVRVLACSRLMAVTVAVLGTIRSRAISPKDSPVPLGAFPCRPCRRDSLTLVNKRPKARQQTGKAGPPPKKARQWPGPPTRATGARACHTGSADQLAVTAVSSTTNEGAGAARPLLIGRRHPPPLAVGRVRLTTVNVRSAVNRVCRRADTACVAWLTLRSGSAPGQARRSAFGGSLAQ